MATLSPRAVNDTGGDYFKVDVINDAYSQLRISGLTVNPTPDDLELALMRYEDMMAEWHTRNITVNYNFEDQPDPNSETNVLRGYKYCMASNLAIRLIADFNKEVPATLQRQASASLSNMSGRVALQKLNRVTYPRRQARGSGNTLRYNRWARFYRQYNTGINNPASVTMFIGDIDDFTEHFDAYLDKGEVIDSYTITTDPGLVLISDSNTDDDVNYRIEASNQNNFRDGSLVTIIVTTDTGRVETRQILFELIPRESGN